MYTSTLFLSFSVLVVEESAGGGSWAPIIRALRVPPQSEFPGRLLEEPPTRATCFEALRSHSSTDNHTNYDSGSQNGIQLGPQNGAQKSRGQMSYKNINM